MKLYFLPSITSSDLVFYMNQFGHSFDVLNNSIPGNFIFLRKNGIELLNLKDNSLQLIFNIVKGLEQSLLNNEKDFFVFSHDQGYILHLVLNKNKIIIRKNEDVEIEFNLQNFIDEIEICSKFCFEIFKFYFFNLKFSNLILGVEDNISNSIFTIRKITNKYS